MPHYQHSKLYFGTVSPPKKDNRVVSCRKQTSETWRKRKIMMQPRPTKTKKLNERNVDQGEKDLCVHLYYVQIKHSQRYNSNGWMQLLTLLLASRIFVATERARMADGDNASHVTMAPIRIIQFQFWGFRMKWKEKGSAVTKKCIMNNIIVIITINNKIQIAVSIPVGKRCCMTFSKCSEKNAWSNESKSAIVSACEEKKCF